MNLRSVLAYQMMGHTQLGLFCATMDLPQPVYKNSYQKMQKKLSINAESLAEKTMVDVAERLFQVTKKEKPENIGTTGYGELPHVLVTVDGTWQKRGHNSKLGVVFVVSVKTGEIIDYSIKSLV